jgi:hypothetical protein
MQTISPAERETAILANKLAVADAPARCFFGCFFDCVATILSSLATDLRFVGYRAGARKKIVRSSQLKLRRTRNSIGLKQFSLVYHVAN